MTDAGPILDHFWSSVESTGVLADLARGGGGQGGAGGGGGGPCGGVGAIGGGQVGANSPPFSAPRSAPTGGAVGGD